MPSTKKAGQPCTATLLACLAGFRILLLTTPATACTADAQCSPGDWCAISASTCEPKLANLQPIPMDPGHVPMLSGACTPSAAAAVCASGVCDTGNNACGLLNGDGFCTQDTQCDNNFCALSGATANTCQVPISAAAMPQDQSVNQGESADITITTAALSAPAQSIALSTSGLPAGVTAQFNPDNVAAGSSSTLTVSADYTAVPGVTTVVTVKASTAAGDQSTSFNLTVRDIVFRDGFE